MLQQTTTLAEEERLMLVWLVPVCTYWVLVVALRISLVWCINQLMVYYVLLGCLTIVLNYMVYGQVVLILQIVMKG